MDKVIVTGGDGFVGSNTIQYFLQQGMTVLAMDVFNVPRRLKPQEGLIYLPCDITNPQAMLDRIPSDIYDTFIHFAWIGSAGAQRTDYGLQMQNALVTVECLKAAHQLGCQRFVCAGSIMEHEVEAAMHTQGYRPSLAYIYGMGKHVAHGLCKSVAADIGIDLIWPMITNAYGVGEYSPRFVNTTLRKIIKGELLQFTQATQNYDFVYISDVARAIFLIAQRGKPFCEYIIGSSFARPLKDFILEMLRELAPNTVPVFGEMPFSGIDLPLDTFDTWMTQRDCEFTAEVDFAQGTRLTMEWLKSV